MPGAPRPSRGGRGLREGDLRARSARGDGEPVVHHGARRAARRHAGVGVGDGQAARRAAAWSSTSPTSGVALTAGGRAGRARGDAPPPAARAVPGGARSACRGTACTTRPRCSSTCISRGARGADRGEARRPDARSARRPDPGRRSCEIDEGETRSLADARGRRPRALRPRLGLRPRDAALPRRARHRARRRGSRSSSRQPFGGPVTVRFGGREHVFGGLLAAAMRVELTR